MEENVKYIQLFRCDKCDVPKMETLLHLENQTRYGGHHQDSDGSHFWHCGEFRLVAIYKLQKNLIPHVYPIRKTKSKEK